MSRNPLHYTSALLVVLSAVCPPLWSQPQLSLPTAPLSYFTNPGVQAYYISQNSVTLVETPNMIQFYVTFDGLTSTSCAGGPCSISNEGPVTNPNGAQPPFGAQSYNAWCPDVYGDFSKNTQSTAYTLYSTYSPSLPLNAQAANWKQVNWVLNNKSIAQSLDPTNYTWIVQQTIWKLLSGSYVTATPPAVYPLPEPGTDTFYNLAVVQSGFVPGPGQIEGVLLYVDGIYPTGSPQQNGIPNIVQELLIEVPTVSTTYVSVGTGVVGVPYSGSVTGIGGVGGPYTFSSAIGLPPGLTMDSSGNITGVPTQSGSFPFTVTVTDKNGEAGTGQWTIVINSAPTASCVSITAVQGVPITPVTMVASGGVGGPYTFSATGLPAGLTMSTGGTISGTPTVSGTFSYTVTIKDSAGNTGTVNCSVTVAPPVTASCVSITAVQGVPITPVTMVASGGVGGPYTFTATGLPAGLTMSTSGTISGTPTVSGTFSYTVTVKDSAGNTGTVNCSVTVAPPVTASCVSITAVQGVPITPVTMIASGGAGGPYTFSATGLPAGLTMSTGGTISGTPTVSGTFSYTVTIKDSAGNTGTVSCSVTVAPPVTASCVSITAVQGVPITPVTMIASGGAGGPYTFTATGLPAGLTMSTSGTISGTPMVSGTFNYTVTITDKAGNKGTVNCSVTVTPSIPPLMVTCASSTGQVGLGFSSSVGVTGGVGPYTFSIIAGSLPPGLTLNPSTGAITGTPSAEGTFSYTVQVVDSAGNKVTTSCTIIITTCGTQLVPVTYNVHENSTIGEIAWFNSHLSKLSGMIPTSTFQIYISGGKITFGPSTLSVPDAVITFSSTATCSSTSFNTAFNRWETTLPLSAASQADEIFAAGIAYLIPSGFPQNVNNVTWSADITSTAPGVQVTWQYGVSNWLTSKNGTSFPALSQSPFVPDYNGMMVNPAHNAPLCNTNYNSGDHAGALEFPGRGDVLTGGGSGGGGSNWTGSWSSTPSNVLVCKP